MFLGVEMTSEISFNNIYENGSIFSPHPEKQQEVIVLSLKRDLNFYEIIKSSQKSSSSKINRSIKRTRCTKEFINPSFKTYYRSLRATLTHELSKGNFHEAFEI